ncbi:hypothetical protein ACHAWF_017631 [Thalassiosira exigua]
MESTSPPSPLLALPSDVLRRIVASLPLSSRASLRRCGSADLRRSLNAFDDDIIRSHRSGGSQNDDASEAARREMIDVVRNDRWLSRRRRDAAPGDGETTAEPGPCHLRRRTVGDHLAEPLKWGEFDSKRQNRFYDDAKLIDDHIWVTHSSYWFRFEIFNLDTGKAVEDFCVERGPDENYANDRGERTSIMMLSTYDGRHGMLAAGDGVERKVQSPRRVERPVSRSLGDCHGRGRDVDRCLQAVISDSWGERNRGILRGASVGGVAMVETF